MKLWRFLLDHEPSINRNGQSNFSKIFKATSELRDSSSETPDLFHELVACVSLLFPKELRKWGEIITEISKDKDRLLNTQQLHYIHLINIEDSQYFK